MNDAIPLGTAEARLLWIRGSLACFWWSLASLIPFFGPFAVVEVLRRRRRLWRTVGGSWNPAGRCLAISGWVTLLGALLSLIAYGLLIAGLSDLLG